MIKTIFTYLLAVIGVLNVLCAKPVTPEDNGVIDVTFDFMNGDKSIVYTAEENSLLTEPQKPQKRGCDFVGWYAGDKKWDFERDTVSADTVLTAKWELNKILYENDPSAAVRTQGSHVRIMSFNILASDWNNKPQVAGRDDLFRDVIARYLPDVIGLQEVNAEWYESLENNFGTYRFVNEDNHEIRGTVNYSTIAYNAEKVTLIEHGQRAYVINENEHCRNIMWALFEMKDTGKRFMVTSTHWELTSIRRVHEAIEMAGIIEILEEKYKVPIFSAGDYNSNELSDEYYAFTTITGFQNTRWTAEKKGLVAASTHLGDGTGTAEDFASGYWKLGAESYRTGHVNKVYTIDHIFASTDAKILYYDTVADKTALEASDHCPIYIDAAI